MSNPYRRTLWQVYREQRLLLLGETIIIVLLLLSREFLFSNRLAFVVDSSILLVIISAPSLFILVSSSLSQSMAREQGVLDELRLATPSSGALLTARMTWIFGGALMQLLLLGIVVGIPNASNLLNQLGLGPVLLLIASWLEAFGWGLFFTTRTKTSLQSLIGAAMALVASAALLNQMIWTLERVGWLGSLGETQSEISKQLALIWYVVRLVVIIPVVVIAIRTWNASLRLGRTSQTTGIGLPVWRFKLSTTSSTAVRRTSRIAVLRVVLWQELRTHGWLIGCLVAVLALTQLCLIDSLIDNPKELMQFNLTGISLLIGAISVRAESTNESWRFLEQMGVAPAMHWLSRWVISVSLWAFFTGIWMLTAYLHSIEFSEGDMYYTIQQISGRATLAPPVLGGMGVTLLTSFAIMVTARLVSQTMGSVILQLVTYPIVWLVFTLIGITWSEFLRAWLLFVIIVGMIAALDFYGRLSVNQVLSSRRRARRIVFSMTLLFCLPASILCLEYWFWLNEYPSRVPIAQIREQIEPAYLRPGFVSNDQIEEYGEMLESKATVADTHYYNAQKLLKFEQQRYQEANTLPSDSRRNTLLEIPDDRLRQFQEQLKLASATRSPRLGDALETFDYLDAEESIPQVLLPYAWYYQGNAGMGYVGESAVESLLQKQLPELAEDRIELALALLDYCDFLHRANQSKSARRVQQLAYDTLWNTCFESELSSQELLDLDLRLESYLPRSYFLGRRRPIYQVPTQNSRFAFFYQWSGHNDRRYREQVANWKFTSALIQSRLATLRRNELCLRSSRALEPLSAVRFDNQFLSKVGDRLLDSYLWDLVNHRAMRVRLRSLAYHREEGRWPVSQLELTAWREDLAVQIDPYAATPLAILSVPSRKLSTSSHSVEELVIWSGGGVIYKDRRSSSIPEHSSLRGDASGYQLDESDRETTYSGNDIFDLITREAFELGHYWGLNSTGGNTDTYSGVRFPTRN